MGDTNRPNILILCMDQWQTHMRLPDGVELPALARLEAQGVTFDRQYCTVPMCTPSRAAMWTGVHAVRTGLWDNTNFAWISALSDEIPTIGHLLREQGYYTAFKGKWHLSDTPHREDALEPYGFADYQQWGDSYGPPLGGALYDNTITFETVDWLEHVAPTLDCPWLLVSSLINPHDIMFLQTDPVQAPNPNGIAAGIQSRVQKLEWFQQEWDVALPDNFADDYAHQPPGVQHYKDYVDQNYGRIPDDRTDLWLVHRNYLLNAMRLVDQQFMRVLDTLDRLDFWQNTVVLFVSDHGEMNGAHRLTQKGNITFDEATVVNLTVCVPGGPRGQRTNAVGSHLDLAPTLLAFAGLSEQEIHDRYPHLAGRSLKAAVLEPKDDGPRGNENTPGDGALLCWDGLHALDNEWAMTGALRQLTFLSLPLSQRHYDRTAMLDGAGRQFGAPDFGKRTFYRAVVDGRYKLVRWFSPEEYGTPTTPEALHAYSDVALYDLMNDPGELENIAQRVHPDYDPALVARMLHKLDALVREEIGEDRAPFDLDLFGTREVIYRDRGESRPRSD